MRRLAALLVLAGCALEGGQGGGSDDLPVSGIGPYRKITDFDFATPLEEPFVLIDLGVDIGDPEPVGTRLFYSRDGKEIWRADIPDLTTPATAMTLALAAAEDWEQGAVRAPSIVTRGQTLVMFYEGGGGGIGRAVSSDGGATWTRSGRILADATSPAAVASGNMWWLYHTLPTHTGIYVATSTDGVSWEERPEPVIEPHMGFFDGRALADPYAVGGITPAGALHIAVFYTGVNGAGLAAIGYAGTDDGLSFVARTTPVMDPNAPGERAPGARLMGTRDVLFFVQDHSGRTGIAAATAP